MGKSFLKDINFVCKEWKGENLIRATIQANYEVERNDGLYKQSFYIPIKFWDRPSISGGFGTLAEDYINLGFGSIISKKMTTTEELIKPRVEKMTIAEIEKKLGYKIEIIDED